MRKVIAATVATLSLAAVTATTAGAQTVTKFSVIALTAVQHPTANHHFVIKGPLVRPGDRDDVLGSFKAEFSGPQRNSHLRGVFFFPDGKIKVNGNQAHNKAPIVAGTRRWNGASGKMKITNLPGPNVILTFTVVQ